MSRPNLLMLDEPSLGLAPIVIEQVFDKILELNKRIGLGVLLVEQNSAMALQIAARALVLETGMITLSGPRRCWREIRGFARRIWAGDSAPPGFAGWAIAYENERLPRFLSLPLVAGLSHMTKSAAFSYPLPSRRGRL